MTTKPIDDFDAEKAVWDYRRVIKQREAARTAKRKSELAATAKRMAKAWTDWQGEDSLYEMAFGEPWQWKDERR